MLLKVKDLTVYYGAIKAIENVSFEVDEGEIIAMIGPNAAGKSTALKAVVGMVKPQNGEIIFEDENIKGYKPHSLVEKGISLVPENRRVFTTMSVLENLEIGAYIRKDKKEIKDDVNKIFELFPILAERRKQRAGTLSTGEQQMLAMGRALMLRPKLLLADEPSLGLSPSYVDLVFDKIKEINENGTSILLVEQNARMALEYADRGYVFRIGEIFLEDTGENLLRSEEVRKAFLGE